MLAPPTVCLCGFQMSSLAERYGHKMCDTHTHGASWFPEQPSHLWLIMTKKTRYVFYATSARKLYIIPRTCAVGGTPSLRHLFSEALIQVMKLMSQTGSCFCGHHGHKSWRIVSWQLTTLVVTGFHSPLAPRLFGTFMGRNTRAEIFNICKREKKKKKIIKVSQNYCHFY